MFSIDGLAATVGIDPELLSDLILTILVLGGYFGLRAILGGLTRRRIADSRARYAVRKAVQTSLGLVLVVALALIWTSGGPGIATYIAILSAGIAVSMGDALGNLAGWFYILSRHPFRLGDRIEVNSHRGDIVDIGVFQFSLAEIGNWVHADHGTGRLLHLPNAWVFRHSIANYTMGFEFIWEEMPITVTFESNWRKAKELLAHLLEHLDDFDTEQAKNELDAAADRFAVQSTYISPAVWTSVADIGVTLTLRYACRPRRRRASTARLWEAVLDLFAAHDDIDFAYPTTRFYDNRGEGKPGARAND